MNILKLMILSLIVLALTTGISSADEFNNSDIISSSDNGSFSELQVLIDDSPENGIVNLTMDYFSDNTDFPNDVVIDKPLTINGNNHVIDANANSRIFNISSSGVVLNDIIFINGKTDQDGGAICFGSDGEVNNCIFINNSAYSGGAVSLVRGGRISNSNFINNSAKWGGAITLNDFSFRAPVSIEGGVINSSIFINNSAYYDAGAIYRLYYDGEVDVYDSSFVNNSAGGSGGAISQGSSCNVYNSIFINNSAERSGGAISQDGSCNVYNSSFDNNYAYYGGAISQGSSCNVYNSSFDNNYAYYGGAIDQFGDFGPDGELDNGCNVYDSSFVNNSAYYSGGAIYQEYGRVHDSSFVNNFAQYGGAIYQLEHSSVYGSYFVNNSADHGGAIFEKNSNVYNCTFENNHAKYGCDNICDSYNHTENNQSDDIAQNYSIDSQSVGNAQNKISSIVDKNTTGNPLGLLILVLFVVIARIKK